MSEVIKVTSPASINAHLNWPSKIFVNEAAKVRELIPKSTRIIGAKQQSEAI